ncbi:MAG: AraC family transcriptional regulator [Chitinophaga sp.]|uniref:helix-turn-helix domain-containing protein n=1 Tax=Chitinophaga sp. TaxID=1869181 RepID=UPI001B1E6D25|nr:helix-turn-helix domain-containing protein [Chitinophaga sp.]MBO9727975.1 AraC family transcriptional regulator [Chitinophaga sp.]
MKADIYQPSLPLSRYIDNYMIVDIDWKAVNQEYAVWRLIPFGQTSMLFLYGDLHQYNMEGAQFDMLQTRRAFMVGQLTKPIWLKFSDHTRLVKVQFKPGGIHQLLPVNMQEFTNVPSVDLEAVWGYTVNLLLEQLFEATSDEQRVALMNQFLEARLYPASGLIDYVDFSIQQLRKNKGNVAVQQLEDQLGISSRHLERLFRTRIGLSPKELGKIMRLNFALSRLKEADISLCAVSHDAGYYDQSHFSRDFKSIAGVAPSKLLSESATELFVTNGKCFI